MRAASRLRWVTLCLCLVCVGSLAGCRKKDPEKAGASALDANEVKAAKQSLDGLAPQLTALKGKYAALRRQVEAIPPALPGFGETRAKFYSTAEGMGIMDPKLAWLSGRLDAAVKSGDRAELQKVSSDVAKTYDELRQIDRLALDLMHELLPFQGAAIDPDDVAFKRVLSTNREISGRADGLEQRLIRFIEDPGAKVDQSPWLDFDRLAFTGKGAGAQRDAARFQSQLENVAEILKAYPAVKLKIAGYTDSTGAAAADKKASKQRAQAVKDELVRLGVAATRLTAEGYGAERPLCPANDTEDCKRKNRRVAVQVTAK